MPWVLGLAFKAWQFRVISFWRCICKIPWPNGTSKLDRGFPSRSLCKKRRISQAAKSLKDLINPKSITVKDFSDYEELDLMMAADLRRCYDKYPYFQKRKSKSRELKRTTDLSEGVRMLFDLRNCIAWSRDKRKGAKILTPNGRLENVFSGRLQDILQEETLVAFYTHACHGRPWDNVGRKWKTQENLAWSKHPLFSTDEKWRNRLTGKTYGLKDGPATEAKNSLSIADKTIQRILWEGPKTQ